MFKGRLISRNRFSLGPESKQLSGCKVRKPQKTFCNTKDLEAPREDQAWRGEFECPVCFSEMIPPMEIHQCSRGHLICGSCRPALLTVSLNKICLFAGFRDNASTTVPYAQRVQGYKLYVDIGHRRKGETGRVNF